MANFTSIYTSALDDHVYIIFQLSLVEYDPSTHDLKTSSLHYFEEDHFKEAVLQQTDIPFVRVDPDNRCAVMMIYGRHLVVLPFRRELIVDEADGKQAGRWATNISLDF